MCDVGTRCLNTVKDKTRREKSVRLFLQFLPRHARVSNVLCTTFQKLRDSQLSLVPIARYKPDQLARCLATVAGVSERYRLQSYRSQGNGIVELCFALS